MAWRPIGCASLVLAAAAMATRADALGAAAAVLAALACAALAALQSAHRSAGEPAGAGSDASEAGARLMGSAVLPVWQRHMEASRRQAEQGSADLLAAFSRISDGLGRLSQATGAPAARIDAGAAGDLIERHAPAIEALLEPMRAAQQAHAQVVEEAGSAARTLDELSGLGKELRLAAKHIGLAALNASIEASRTDRHSGAAAIAIEVRELAVRAESASARLCDRLAILQGRFDALRHEAELAATSREQTRMETFQQARALVRAMLGDAHTALSFADGLHEIGAQLQSETEAVFMSLQHQDRLDQMMANLQQDMNRLQQWLAEGKGATHTDAARWLEDLERTYTMEEQRSRHHATVEISRQAAVEFF